MSSPWVQIGGFYLKPCPPHTRYNPEKGHQVDVEGAVLMELESGEMMQLEGRTLATLEALLAQFWKDHF